MKKTITLTLAIALLSACATSPTGRKQLIIMPDSQMDLMGAQAFDQMRQQQPVERDAAWNAYVRCIALPITEALKQSDGNAPKEWEVIVFKDPSANAFALPGGKIGVHTGLMKVAKTDGQLAAVLGHEVGHVVARHGNERVSEAFAVQGGQAALAAVVGTESTTKQIAFAALGVGAQVGVLLPHSRTQESEADVIGLDLMSRAGFEPSQSVDLWKNMMAESKGAPPEILSTHPAGETRIENLRSNLKKYTPVYEKVVASGKAPKCTRPSVVPKS